MRTNGRSPVRGLILVTIRFGFAFAPQLAIAQASGVVQGDAPIVAPGAKLERLFGEGFFTEGPAPAPDGSVYFSDITVGKASGYQAGYIWRWDPQTRTSTVFRSPSGMSNGMLFDAQGRLVVAEGAWFGGRRITRTDMKTGKSVILAALFDGRPFNSPNDVALDARGRIYFTDPRYVGWEPIEQPVQGVYRIDPDGRVSAPGRKALLAYDLAPDGSAKFRRAVVDFSPAGPDGITVDREGNIYCAVQGERQGIYAYSPAGKELAYIPTPESPTNVKFGRAGDAQTLFITAGKSLYRIRVERTGVTRE